MEATVAGHIFPEPALFCHSLSWHMHINDWLDGLRGYIDLGHKFLKAD